jgi:hypothetical protein
LYPRGAQQPSNPTARHLYKVINRDGKTGFVDQTGQLVIGFDRFPADVSIGDFHEGLAVICFPEPPYNGCRVIGYIDEKGDLAIAPRPYRAALYFREGLAYVGNDEMRGFIDRDGKLVISLASDQNIRFGFYEGRCVIVTPQGQGFIDRTGKIVIEPRYSHVSSFSEGLAAVGTGDRSHYYHNMKYGFIDRDGKMVIPPRFEARVEGGPGLGVTNIDTSRFSEGLARVRVGGLYGYINKRGDFVIPPKFALAGDFSEGLASAVENDKVGFIDKRGRWVIPPRFYNPGPYIIHQSFGDELVPVAVLTGRSEMSWGYVDKTGKLVIQPTFADAFPFKDGVARVRVSDPFCKCLADRYIDKTGRFIWEPK